jgi:putative sigma-54 modulation protein
MATHRLPSHTSCEIPFTVEARGLELKNSHHRAIRRILASTLGRFTKRVRAIRIWLEDVNGPRGGKDIRCRIEGHLHPEGSINVSALAIHEYAATARAAARARELVDRRVKKIRSRRRDPLWRMD